MESAYGNNIIQSMLDTDYYTFTMMQAVLHQHPGEEVEYQFIVRSKESLVEDIPEIRKQMEVLCNLEMREDELRFLGDPVKRGYLKPDFIRFLSLYRFNLRYVHVFEQDGNVAIRVRGPWLHTIMFEQPILSMISEIRNRRVYPDVTLEAVREKLYAKFDSLHACATQEELSYLRVADFSTRRRLSFEAQREMVQIMKADFPGVFTGTSNVHLGHEYDLPVIGTMAHQWLMAYQQFGRLRESQSAALEGWVKEYRGDLGVALTDCISSDFFLSEFDSYFTKLFDGLRHDSGNPFEWGEKVIAHYKKMGIDPASKSVVFSDSLNFDTCLELIRVFKGRLRMSFGIGTNLGCDVEGVTPLSIVMKLVEVNGDPVVKFSDDPVKVVCNSPSFLEYAKNVFKIA
ncbi:nicotinate phosphoribosyltransferase (plasmid) [Pseudomonas sp. FeN3W]|nr:nicotinate phosphoribosyltransferase [Pseudomonas sp. FeN3W]